MEIGVIGGATDVVLAKGEDEIVGEVVKVVGARPTEVIVGGNSAVVGGLMLVTGLDVGSELGCELRSAVDDGGGGGGGVSDVEGRNGGSDLEASAGADVGPGLDDVGCGAELEGASVGRASLEVGAGSSEVDGTGRFVTVDMDSDIGGFVGMKGRGGISVGRSMIGKVYFKLNLWIYIKTKQSNMEAKKFNDGSPLVVKIYTKDVGG